MADKFNDPTQRFPDDLIVNPQDGLDAEEVAAISALPSGSALLVVKRGASDGARFLLDTDLAKAGRHAGALGPLVGHHGSGFVNPLHDGACGHAAAGAVGRGFCHKTQDGRGGGHGLLRGHAGPQKFFMRPIIHESRDRVAAVARLNVTVCRGKAARRTGRLASTAALVCYCIDS